MSNKKSEAGAPAVVDGDVNSPSKINAVDINDIIDNPFELPLLDKYLGMAKSKDGLLSKCSIDNAKFGDFAILVISDNGSEPVIYRSNSKAVISQVGKLLSSGDNFGTGILIHVTKKSASSGDYISLLG